MILIDTHSVAQLPDARHLTSTGVHGENWACSLWDSGNARLILAPVPEPWQAGCWQWNEDSDAWTMIALPQDFKRWAHARIDEERVQRVAAGMPYTFPDGKGTVQLRNEQDIININGIATSAMLLISAQDATTTISFRDQEDVTHMLTAKQATEMAQTVMAWMSGHYAAAWKHKEAIDKAVASEELTTLMGYDFTTGWVQAQEEESLDVDSSDVTTEADA